MYSIDYLGVKFIAELKLVVVAIVVLFLHFFFSIHGCLSYPSINRSVLFGQWGFAKRNHQGLTILLHGDPGTGKTLVAEAIGYEIGKPLKVVNCGELLSKWVGESTKNIDAIFQEARHQDAILVVDEAEGLFGKRTRNLYVT